MENHNYSETETDNKNIPTELFHDPRYKLFKNKYRFYLFFIKESIFRQLYLTFISGFEQGLQRSSKGNIDEGLLQIKGDYYHGYDNYGKHKGSSIKVDAEISQKRNTTLLEGNDLARMKLALDNFRTIIENVELMTGLQAFSVEIIGHSETGKKDCEETMFSLHKDTYGKKMDTQLTTFILFSGTSSSMRVLNFQPIKCLRRGSAHVFLSNMYHETLKASEGTINFRCSSDLGKPRLLMVRIDVDRPRAVIVGINNPFMNHVIIGIFRNNSTRLKSDI